MPNLPQGQTTVHRDYAVLLGRSYLNNGSFGPPPHAVVEARRRFQDRLDANPMQFLVRELESELAEAARILAEFVGTSADNLVFVPNATTAMNVVAVSLPLESGDEVLLNDHEYGAVRRIWEYQTAAVGAKVVTAELPYPLRRPADVVEAIFAHVTPRTRLIVVSHVTSPTAVIFPVAEIARRARELGVAVAVDGPHAVAMLDVRLDELDVDYYCASCHKWLSAPMGSGFLYVHPRRQAAVVPAVRSWGRPQSGASATWRDEFTWVGTDDPAKYLAVPAAIAYLRSVGLDKFRDYGHALAAEARRRIEELTGLPAFVPDDPAWYGTMITLPLPPGDAPALMQAMWCRHAIEIPVIDWNGRRYIRPSFHLYNSAADVDRLVGALRQELDKERFAACRSPRGGPYRLMSPAAPADRAAWPLVIFLHGAGERGDDNCLQLSYLPTDLASDDLRRRFPCYCLAVQCPEGDKWADVDWSDPSTPPSPVDTRAMQNLRSITAEVLAANPIDCRRIYLTGISMGGFGVWHWATAEPELFAAVAPICAGGDPDRAAALKNTPIWAVHGDRDDAVPVERSRRTIEAIRAAGGTPRYSELAGVGHHSWTPAYDPAFGLLDWMFQQRR